MFIKTISDESYINNLLNNLYKEQEISVSIHIQDKHLLSTMSFNYKKKVNLNILLDNKDGFLSKGESIDVIFVYQEILFKFTTSVLELKKDHCIIEKPSCLYTTFKRLVKRYVVEENENLVISFPNSPISFKPADISTKGLCLICNEKILFEGQALNDIKIILPNGEELYVDGEVRRYKEFDDKYIYGIVFIDEDLWVYHKLFDYIFKKAYSDLKNLSDCSIDEIFDLYSASKNLSLNYENNTDTLFKEKVRQFYKLKDKRNIFSGVVHYKEDKLLNIGSILRIYNQTFLVQQFLATPEAKSSPKANSNIQIALANVMLNHPHFENCLIYNKSDIFSKDLFNRINNFIENNNDMLVDELEHYVFEINSSNEMNTAEHYYTIISKNPDEFLEYCKKTLPPLMLKCYCYQDKTSFSLKNLEDTYEALNLFISRRLWKVFEKSKLVAFVVAETYSNEINIDKFNDMARIYFINKSTDLKSVICIILPELKRFYNRYGKKVFNVCIPSIHCADTLHNKKDQKEQFPQDEVIIERPKKYKEIHGLAYKGSIQRVIMNCNGLSQFRKILASNSEHYTKYYPLSHPQKAIWYMEKVYPGTSIGNIAGTLRIKDKIDYKLLEGAINLFIEKNDAMCLRIIDSENEPRQYVAKYEYKKLDFFDFSKKNIEEYYAWEKKQTQIPFKLTNSELFYFALIKINENSGGFYIKASHLIVDAWSTALLGSQIMEYYHALKNNTQIKSGKNGASYIDYILREEEYKYSDKFIKNKQFWNQKFDSIPECIALKPHTANYTNVKAERKTFVVSKEMSSKIRDYSRQSHNSIFTLFMAVMYIYIYKITMKKDIVLGTSILNRSNVKEKDTIGMFVSTIPVRISIDQHLTFEEFIQLMSKELMLFLKNQKYPYELILNDYRKSTETSDVLYDILVSYQNASLEKNIENNYSTRWHFNQSQIEALILHINDRDDEGQFILNFDYRVDLFSEDEIKILHEHFINIMMDAIFNPDTQIFALKILSDKEKNKLLYEFNNTHVNYPRNKTIHQLFEEQAEKTPDNVAVVFENKELTYRALNEKANQLARELRYIGITPDDIIGIMVEPSLEMIIGILAILKAGGAYLPIDPNYPKDRIEFVLKDSNASILLTKQTLLKNHNENIKVLFVDNIGAYNGVDTNLDKINEADNLAYIIYTSGTTGKPKGALINHANVISLMKSSKLLFDFKDNDVWTLFHSYCFDFSVWELFGALLYGAKLIIVPKHIAADVKQYYKLLKDYKVTVLNQTPSAFYNLINEFLQNEKDNDKLFNLRYVIFGGEALNFSKLANWKKRFPSVKLINMYGITETTVHVTFKEITDKDILLGISNIGVPIPTLKTYILDENLQLLPIGMVGEIFVSGLGVSRGYLNRPELTKERFLKNPFDPETKLYRSGDLGKWLPSGEIEYFGRSDKQVKIRGFRIEINEIEAQLLKHASIKEAVVLDKDDVDGNKFLCAYLVAEKDITVASLREFLSKNLPDYMIPAHFVRIEKIPLTSNGKLDKKSLPDPIQNISTGVEKVPPRNATEQKIANTWEQVLNITNVSMKDNFFHLGGDSFSALKVVSMLEKEVTFSDIYQYPTVESLAEWIDNKGLAKRNYLISMNKSKNDPAVTLVCVPYGGGSAEVYIPLSDELLKLSNNLSIYSVNLPGHNFGESQVEYKEISEIASIYCEEICRTIKTDIILYGHCVGSALTLEIARLLTEREVNVKAVCLGAILLTKKHFLLGKLTDPWKIFSDNQVLMILRRLGGFENLIDNRQLSYIMKAFRHDVKEFYKYFNKQRKENDFVKFNIPIHCIVGDKDPMTHNYMTRYKDWTYFSDQVYLHVIKNANHYFLKHNAKELAYTIWNIIFGVEASFGMTNKKIL